MLFGGKGNYSQPPAGAHSAVCVDVIMHLDVETEFQGVKKTIDQLEIRWVIDEIDPATGTNFVARRTFTASLGQKSALRPFLETWRGVPFTPQDLSKGFDEERLVGVPALLNIIHRVSKVGNTYSVVASAGKLPKGMEPISVPSGYVREKDQERVVLDDGREPDFGDAEDSAPF